MANRIRISPSILAADFARLADEIAKVEPVADMLHLDVMDGHLVPNITFGPPVVARIRQATSMFLDAHLMISEPEKYIERFAEAGADHITVHIEAEHDAADLIKRIHDLGKDAGITLNPDTPIETIEPVLGMVEMVLIMTVPAGFGGQEFREDALPKIEWVRKRQPDLPIEADGGINADTVVRAVRAGADTFVAGTAIFGDDDPGSVVVNLRTLGEKAREAAG